MVLNPAWSQGGKPLGPSWVQSHMAGLFRPALHWASMQTRVQHTVPPPWKPSFLPSHPLIHSSLPLYCFHSDLFPPYIRETTLFGLVVPVLREAWKEVSTISRTKFAKKNSKTTAPRIPAWSPTVVLTRRHSGWLRRSDGMRCFQSPMAVDIYYVPKYPIFYLRV